jgi:hypothetical protein
MPTITLPEMKRPGMKRPEMKRPGVKLPEVKLPEVKLPDMKMPEIDLPDVVRDRRDDLTAAAGRVRDELPELELPRVDLPRIRDLRRAAAREIDPSPSRLPFLAGAALVGLLVGWILAMSPITGPRIRSSLRGLRERFDAWRTGPNDWDADEAGEDTATYVDPMATVMRTDPWIGPWANGTGVDPAEAPVGMARTGEGFGTESKPVDARD